MAVGGGGDTINVDATGRRSQILVFDTLQGANINVSNSSGWQRVGNTVVLIDSTPQQMADRGVGDVRDAVRDICTRSRRRTGQPSTDQHRLLYPTLRSTRRQAETRTTAAYTANTAGAVVGIETAEIDNTRIGAFAGGALGNARGSGSDPLTHQANLRRRGRLWPLHRRSLLCRRLVDRRRHRRTEHAHRGR